MAVGTASGLLNKIFGSLKVFLVARYLIQFAKGHLDDGMPARTVNLSLVGAEGLADKIGILDGHIEEGLLACGTIMSYGTLDEVTGVIKFMRVDLFPLV